MKKICWVLTLLSSIIVFLLGWRVVTCTRDADALFALSIMLYFGAGFIRLSDKR